MKQVSTEYTANHSTLKGAFFYIKILPFGGLKARR